MKELGRNMQVVTDGISREDRELVAKTAFRLSPSAAARGSSTTCIVHGETAAADARAEKLAAMRGWNVTVPEPGTTLHWPPHAKEARDD